MPLNEFICQSSPNNNNNNNSNLNGNILRVNKAQMRFMQHDRQRPSAEVAPSHTPNRPCPAHLLRMQVSLLVLVGTHFVGIAEWMAITVPALRYYFFGPCACLLTQLIFRKQKEESKQCSDTHKNNVLLRGDPGSGSGFGSGSTSVCPAIYSAQNCHINFTASETCRAFFILYFMIFFLTG